MKETNNRHGRVPLILSAFFCPGAGQFMQRRWIAAVFFSVTFLIFAALVMVEVLRPMFHNVTVALDWASEGETSGQLSDGSAQASGTAFIGRAARCGRARQRARRRIRARAPRAALPRSRDAGDLA